MTATEVLEKSVGKKEVQKAIIFLETNEGWTFEYSTMPVEVLCFAKEILQLSIHNRMTEVSTRNAPAPETQDS